MMDKLNGWGSKSCLVYNSLTEIVVVFGFWIYKVNLNRLKDHHLYVFASMNQMS